MFPWSRTLVDIVCHALFLSHPGVLKEQSVSCKDSSGMVDLLASICQFAALPSPVTFLILILLLGLLLQLGS